MIASLEPNANVPVPVLVRVRVGLPVLVAVAVPLAVPVVAVLVLVLVLAVKAVSVLLGRVPVVFLPLPEPVGRFFLEEEREGFLPLFSVEPELPEVWGFVNDGVVLEQIFPIFSLFSVDFVDLLFDMVAVLERTILSRIL